jgi:threonine 3-dehydrogenase
VVVTDLNPYRLDLAKRLGATRVVNVAEEKLADVQRELGMAEGFDVGCEMSGSPAAFRDLLAQMCHGGKVALLGIPGQDVAIDWNTVVFNMLTLQGIYGREMYETWYKMTVMLQSGLEIKPVITHRYPAAEFEEGFATMMGGRSGKVILDWRAPG